MIPLNKEATLIIPTSVKSQVDFLHQAIPKKEWSGILLYEKTGGDYRKLTNLTFTAIGIYPMDIGSSASTEFDYQAAMAEVYSLFPDKLETMKTGLVHSHHSMGAFFSATDISELEDNTKFFNFYMSLIVNHVGPWECRIAIPAESKGSINHIIKDEDGRPLNIKEQKESLTTILYIDVDVEIEGEGYIPEWFTKKADEIEKKATAKPYSYGGSYDRSYGGSTHGKWGGSDGAYQGNGLHKTSGYVPGRSPAEVAKPHNQQAFQQQLNFQKAEDDAEEVKSILALEGFGKEDDKLDFYENMAKHILNHIVGETFKSLEEILKYMAAQPALSTFSERQELVKLLVPKLSQVHTKLYPERAKLLIEDFIVVDSVIEIAQTSLNLDDSDLLFEIKDLLFSYEDFTKSTPAV